MLRFRTCDGRRRRRRLLAVGREQNSERRTVTDFRLDLDVTTESSNYLCTTAKPRPWPVAFVVKNGSKILGRSAWLMPQPVSETVNSI